MSELDQNLIALNRKVDLRMEKLLINRVTHRETVDPTASKTSVSTSDDGAFDRPVITLPGGDEELVLSFAAEANDSDSKVSEVDPMIEDPVSNLPAIMPERRGFLAWIWSRLDF